MDPRTTLLVQAAVVLGLMLALGALKYYTRRDKLDRYTRQMARGRRRVRPLPPPPSSPSPEDREYRQTPD